MSIVEQKKITFGYRLRGKVTTEIFDLYEVLEKDTYETTNDIRILGDFIVDSDKYAEFNDERVVEYISDKENQQEIIRTLTKEYVIGWNEDVIVDTVSFGVFRMGYNVFIIRVNDNILGVFSALATRERIDVYSTRYYARLISKGLSNWNGSSYIDNINEINYTDIVNIFRDTYDNVYIDFEDGVTYKTNYEVIKGIKECIANDLRTNTRYDNINLPDREIVINEFLNYKRNTAYIILK